MLRRSLRFKPLSLIEIGSSAAGHAVTLGLAITGYGVWSLVIGGLVAATLRTLCLHTVTPERVLPSFGFVGARQLVSFGASITFTRFLWYVFLQADIVIAGKMLGKEAVGLYSVAVHLASLPMQRVASVVNDVAFAAFARIQDDRQAIAANVRSAVRLVSLFAFPALWGLGCVAPDLVELVMGPRWLAAIVPLQIVALAVPVRMVGAIVSTITISVGRVDIAMLTTLIGTLLAPPLFYLSTSYGIVGLAVVWATLSPLMLSINLFRALPNLGLTPTEVFAEMGRPVVAAFVMAAAVLAVKASIPGDYQVLRLAAEIAIGALIYIGATALINRASALDALRLLFPRWSEGSRLSKPP
jgi:O-antigen/teichoic acid export membrane protein